MNRLYRELAVLGDTLGAQKVIIYGSRARGDNRENSDIDIAVFGMPGENQNLFCDRAEDLETLLELDILFVKSSTDKKLMEIF